MTIPKVFLVKGREELRQWKIPIVTPKTFVRYVGNIPEEEPESPNPA